MSEAFHGRPVRKVKEVSEVYHEPAELADLGRLVELQLIDERDYVTPLEFKGNVRCTCTPDGGQIYIVGGDQALDLKRLGHDKYLPKDHITLGPVAKITYFTSKAFHNFEPSDYEHMFGEEGGELPLLHYDVHSQKLYLTGGSYQVRPEGIVN